MSAEVRVFRDAIFISLFDESFRRFRSICLVKNSVNRDSVVKLNLVVDAEPSQCFPSF